MLSTKLYNAAAYLKDKVEHGEAMDLSQMLRLGDVLTSVAERVEQMERNIIVSDKKDTE